MEVILCTNFRFFAVRFYLDLLHNRPFYSCVLSYLAMNASEAGVDQLVNVN